MSKSAFGKNTCEKDGNIYVRLVRKGSNGRPKQITRLVGPTDEVNMKAVRKVMRELENEVEEKGVQAYENKDTLNEWLDGWLVIVKPTLRERTYIDYKNVCRLYVRPILGKRKLKDINVTQVELLVSQLQARGLRSRSVRYACTVLGMALRHAKRRKLISENPVEDVSNLPKKDTREMTALTPEQGIKFLKNARKVSQWLIFKFALMTGMRPEEYLGLQWKDIDLKASTATIQRTVYWPRYVDEKSEMFEKRGKWRFESTKTEKSRRTLDLPGTLVADLGRHRKTQMAYRLKRGDKYQNFDLVFASETGTPISCRNLSRALKGVLDTANLPDMRPRARALYDLRHSFASLLLGAGENIKVISGLLGHSDETETMRTYLHVTPAMKRNSTDTLAKILGK